jgi:hypothetical protein
MTDKTAILNMCRTSTVVYAADGSQPLGGYDRLLVVNEDVHQKRRIHEQQRGRKHYLCGGQLSYVERAERQTRESSTITLLLNISRISQQ